MELSDFIKNTLSIENRMFFYDLIKSACSHKELFYQMVENFPKEKEYTTYKKDLIAKFFYINTITDEKDFQIIKSVNPFFTKSDIKNIIGKNIHIQNIESYFDKKQNESDIIKSFASGLNKIKYHDQEEIDKQGEIILKKIINDNIVINPTNHSGKMFLSVLNGRTPTNILSILEHVSDYNNFNDTELNRAIRGKLGSNKFSNITLFNDYIRLKEAKNPFIENIIYEDTIIAHVFTKTAADIQTYGDLVLPEKIKQLEKIHTLFENNINFGDWFKANIQKPYKDPQNHFQKPYFDELLSMVENDILEKSIPKKTNSNKTTTKI